jgi:hypothetical protein
MAGALLLYCTHGNTIEQSKRKRREGGMGATHYYSILEVLTICCFDVSPSVALDSGLTMRAAEHLASIRCSL